MLECVYKNERVICTGCSLSATKNEVELCHYLRDMVWYEKAGHLLQSWSSARKLVICYATFRLLHLARLYVVCHSLFVCYARTYLVCRRARRLLPEISGCARISFVGCILLREPLQTDVIHEVEREHLVPRHATLWLVVGAICTQIGESGWFLSIAAACFVIWSAVYVHTKRQREALVPFD